MISYEEKKLKIGLKLETFVFKSFTVANVSYSLLLVFLSTKLLTCTARTSVKCCSTHKTGDLLLESSLGAREYGFGTIQQTNLPMLLLKPCSG